VQAQPYELFRKRINGSGKRAGQRTQCSPCRLRCTRVDKVRYRFGLSQVELVVQKGALREFTRLGLSRTHIDYCVHYHRYDQRTAVAVELQNRLAGKRGRCRKVQGQTGVELLAMSVAERAEAGVSRFGQATQHNSCY
jgi:hypothetical protein